MRPPSHPVDTVDFGLGVLYEPGPHTFVFLRVEVTHLRQRTYFVPRVVHLPWLLVTPSAPFGSYVACHALMFEGDPREASEPEYVSLATVLGNQLEGGRTCLGKALVVDVDADLWNTAFTHENLAINWTNGRLGALISDGATSVTRRSP